MSIPVIALCGLDGVGKTSILRALSQHEALADIYFVGRGPADAESTVENYYPRSGEVSDWLEGDFNRAIAAACAIDYVAYYRSVITPVLSGYDQSGRRYRAIVCDRHIPCFNAFAKINSEPSRLALDLLSSVPHPDCIINITLDRTHIKKRRGDDGEELYEFERDACQDRQLQAYQEVFADSICLVVEVSNDRSLEFTVERIVSLIDEVCDEQ